MSVSQEQRDEAVIRTPDRRLRVFVSSTLGELAEERRAVSRAISVLRLTPVMFEVGARPYPPAEVYRAYLAQADVFIGVYWQRYGQPASGTQVSGLEEEFGLSGGLPRLLYVKTPASDRDPRLAEFLDRIKAEASASYRHFRTPAELGRLVRDDLAVLLSERFAAGAQGAAATPAAGGRAPCPLPASVTSLLGRERAVGSVGTLEQILGRYDDALGHLREADDLGGRFGITWLTAWSRERLGTLFILRGDLPQAQALLDQALDLSVAARSTASVTVCLAAHARVAFAQDNPERAARLQGAAEGLRGRIGLRVWPTLRQGEAELVTQARQTLGMERFDQAFSAGSALSRREAVAIVRNQRGVAPKG